MGRTHWAPGRALLGAPLPNGSVHPELSAEKPLGASLLGSPAIEVLEPFGMSVHTLSQSACPSLPSPPLPLSRCLAFAWVGPYRERDRKARFRKVGLRFLASRPVSPSPHPPGLSSSSCPVAGAEKSSTNQTGTFLTVSGGATPAQKYAIVQEEFQLSDDLIPHGLTDPGNRGLTEVTYCVLGGVSYCAVPSVTPIFCKLRTSSVMLIPETLRKTGSGNISAYTMYFPGLPAGSLRRVRTQDREGARGCVQGISASRLLGLMRLPEKAHALAVGRGGQAGGTLSNPREKLESRDRGFT